MGKLLKRKCEANNLSLTFRIIASKAIYSAETKCREITIPNTSLESTWRVILTEAGYQLNDNLEVQTSNWHQKSGTGWVAKLDEKVGPFVAKYKIKKKQYLIKIRQSHVTDCNNLENGRDEGRAVNGDRQESENEREKESMENPDVIDDDEDIEDGFRVPIITNVRSLNAGANADRSEEPDDEEEMIYDQARGRFLGLSNGLLLRAKHELQTLKAEDRRRYNRAIRSAPTCLDFIEELLEI